MQNYKHELDIQLEKTVRANSTDACRHHEHKKQKSQIVSLQHVECDARGQPADSEANQLFSASLRQIQQQMMLPASEPLPEVFEHYYRQFMPPLDEPSEKSDDIQERIEWTSLLTTDIQKASLCAKAEAIRSNLLREVSGLMTSEQRLADQEKARENYKPPVELSPQQRYIAEQRKALEDAKFPVETFPQLAIFTKLSSLNVNDIKQELSQQIEALERAHDLSQKISTSAEHREAGQQDAKAQTVYEHNFLRELRAKHAQMWNQEIERINCQQEPREFRRKRTGNPPIYDAAEIEHEITQTINELNCSGTDSPEEKS